jgi:hypothetical protein
MKEKEKDLEYFPYLPYSQVEDNKRCQRMLRQIKNDPFTFHKKKSSLTNLIRINNQKDTKENQELLFFQRRHDKDINSYNNFMKKKNATIDTNARNYLNYILNNKPKENKIKNEIDYNAIKENINANINNFPRLNHSNSNININIKDEEDIEKRQMLFNNQKSSTQKNIFIENNKQEFIANLKKRRTDITNPSYFNGVGEEIMKLNNDIMNYNLKEAEKKMKRKKINGRNSINEDIPLGPEKIRNINYYSIGESSLSINPIINKGSYFENELKNRNNNNRKKTDLMII